MGAEQVISLCPPEEAKRLGRLPPASIVGHLAQDGDGTRFVPDAGFTRLLHEVVRAGCLVDPGFQAEAARLGTGWVYVIDLRTPNGVNGDVPLVDIVGGLQVESGRFAPDSYWANAAYLAWTADGLLQLPPSLARRLREAVRERDDPPEEPAAPAPRRGFWARLLRG